jgi:cell division protease FtsH
LQLPIEERYLMTESGIRAKLVALLGGRASEELVFGEASTGAENDLQKATDIARAMVIDYGMSEAVGPISVRSEPRPLFLGNREGHGSGIGMVRDIGASLANTIDAEIKRIVEEARQRALQILRDNRDALDTIAKRLIDREQLEGEELEKLLKEARANQEARAHPSVVVPRAAYPR